MIVAGFNDYKKDFVCKIEKVLCKEEACETCPASDVCVDEEKNKEKGENK
jgi:hypothetical protein